MRTLFSVPADFKNNRRNSSGTTDNSSSPLRFLPVFSPFLNSTPATPVLSNREIIKSLDSIPSQFRRYSIDLKDRTTPSTERKQSIISDINQNNENKNTKQGIFYFPEHLSTPTRRRSSSISYSINPRKTKYS